MKKRIFDEKNIAYVIIINSVIIILATMGFISYYFVSKEFKDFEIDEKTYRTEYYEQQKSIIKREVDSVIDLIDFKLLHQKNEDVSVIQKEISEWIEHIRFGEENNYYVFVYDVLDLNGGDKFAKMLINPNRDDLKGKYLSSNFRDLNGKKFREEFLLNIRKSGESYTTYTYKKPNSNDKMRLKLSYFKYYPEWNWIVAAGVYLDDVDETINNRRAVLEIRAKKELSTTFAIVFIIFIVALFFSFLLSEQIKAYFEDYKMRLKKKTEAIEEFNKTLEQRVKDEIEKNREKEQLLIHKARLISLGEMISNIAHQWRQPLSQMSSILMTLKMKQKLKKLDDDYFDLKAKEAENLMEYMSSTIDVFRNFFSPNKDQKIFTIEESINNAYSIVRSALSNNDIAVKISIEPDLKVNGVESELDQVFLNLLSNAKDSLVENSVKNPTIDIYGTRIDENVLVEILDNGGGISKSILHKIFDPFFSTKGESQSSGIGLYMSKLIIEKNLGGELRVENREKGACFIIKLPLV